MLSPHSIKLDTAMSLLLRNALPATASICAICNSGDSGVMTNHPVQLSPNSLFSETYKGQAAAQDTLESCFSFLVAILILC